MPRIEEDRTKYYCDYCNYLCLVVDMYHNTSYEINFICGECGKAARYATACSDTLLKSEN